MMFSLKNNPVTEYRRTVSVRHVRFLGSWYRSSVLFGTENRNRRFAGTGTESSVPKLPLYEEKSLQKVGKLYYNGDLWWPL